MHLEGACTDRLYPKIWIDPQVCLAVIVAGRLYLWTINLVGSLIVPGCSRVALSAVSNSTGGPRPEPGPPGNTTLRPCLLFRYFHPRKMWGYVEIWCSPNTLKSPQILFPKNTLPWWRVFNLAKNTVEWRGFVGISRDYPLKIRTSKQPIRKIPGFEIIPSHLLKYARSKQGLDVCVRASSCPIANASFSLLYMYTQMYVRLAARCQ
jgi:hypothetical protein